MTPTAAESAYSSLKELAALADLAARHGWRLDRSHDVDNEIAWDRSGHRVVVIMTASGRIRRCGFGYQSEPDSSKAEWGYDRAGELALADGGLPSMTMQFWERRTAGEAGLAGMVRRWLASQPGVGAGDLIRFQGQWLPVMYVTSGHVTAIAQGDGRVLPVSVGRYEIEAHQFARPVDQLSAEMVGRWLVFSLGSAHVWDLDVMTYTRLPGPESVGSFPCDGQPMGITRVDRWPAVGSTSLVWYDDPEHPQSHEHWRQSSTIIAITRAPANSAKPGQVTEDDPLE